LYAFSFPERLKTNFDRFSFMDYPELTFEKPDRNVFRSINLCYDAMNKGGNLACILNAANEEAVYAFLKDEIKFLEIYDLLEQTIQKVRFIKHPAYSDYVDTDKESREIARSIIKQMKQA
jgi:1-deoxy-D-xylulose-5-phosphate reductoisomerase